MRKAEASLKARWCCLCSQPTRAIRGPEVTVMRGGGRVSCSLRTVDSAACQRSVLRTYLVINSGCPQAPPAPTLPSGWPPLEPCVPSAQRTRGPLGLLRPVTCFTS